MKKNGWIGVIIAVIVLIGIIAACSGGANDESKSTGGGGNNTTAQTQKDYYGVNEAVTQSDITVTLLSVSEVTPTNQYMKPTDGNVFVSCEFLIENNSKSEMNVSSMLNFSAYADGFSINQSLSAISAAGTKSQLDGSVAAGKKMQGFIGYEVPKTWKEIEIEFNPNAFSNKSMKFKYTK